MNHVVKLIRESTSLNMTEFCSHYLDSDWRTFGKRLKEKRLYPNEVVLICMLTGATPFELFGLTTFEQFYFKGNEIVNKQIKELLKQPYAKQKLNIILNDTEGLKFVLK